MDRTNIFVQKEYPHIDLREVVFMQVSRKLWPLCGLKMLGSCQGIAIVPPEVHMDGDLYYWESAPNIKSCIECEFHKNNCERC